MGSPVFYDFSFPPLFVVVVVVVVCCCYFMGGDEIYLYIPGNNRMLFNFNLDYPCSINEI